jgi:hypothetical protein
MGLYGLVTLMHLSSVLWPIDSGEKPIAKAQTW